MFKTWICKNELKRKEAGKTLPSEQIGSTGASSGLHRVLLSLNPGILDWLIIKPDSRLCESNMVCPRHLVI